MGISIIDNVNTRCNYPITEFLNTKWTSHVDNIFEERNAAPGA
jgi:hypothetical protein